jgi:hypothetical protein
MFTNISTPPLPCTTPVSRPFTRITRRTNEIVTQQTSPGAIYIRLLHVLFIHCTGKRKLSCIPDRCDIQAARPNIPLNDVNQYAKGKFMASILFGEETRGGEIKSRGEALNMLKNPRFVDRAFLDAGKRSSFHRDVIACDLLAACCIRCADACGRLACGVEG